MRSVAVSDVSSVPVLEMAQWGSVPHKGKQMVLLGSRQLQVGAEDALLLQARGWVRRTEPAAVTVAPEYCSRVGAMVDWEPAGSGRRNQLQARNKHCTVIVALTFQTLHRKRRAFTQECFQVQDDKCEDYFLFKSGNRAANRLR